MACSPTVGASIIATLAASAAQSVPAQGAVDSAGAGITGGYTGDSLSLKIIIAFFLGLALYNAIELIVLIFVTFRRYHGLYFWSMLVAAMGIIPYSLGFIIKFFQLLDPNRNIGYVAVFLLTIGWYPMVTGQSVVLWSRLHLLSNSRRVLRWTLLVIIINGVVLHSITTVLTFGSNSNSLRPRILDRFVRGYSIMEKTQMVGFFVQEVMLSAIYIKEAVRMLKLSEAVHDDTQSFDGGNEDGTGQVLVRNSHVRKTMYQLLVINIIIIAMDLALLGVEFANLYLIETTLKGAVYSIKLKLEFAVLGKLVQFVRHRTESGDPSPPQQPGIVLERRGTSSGATLEKTETSRTAAVNNNITPAPATPFCISVQTGTRLHTFPDFVDAGKVRTDITHAQQSEGDDNTPPSWEIRAQDGENWRRRTKASRASWIDEEMDKHNIG